MINKEKVRQFQQMQSQIGAVEINSWMFPYVLGYRDRVPFFNIEETLLATQKALNFIQQVHKKKGTILLVNTNPLFQAPECPFRPQPSRYAILRQRRGCAHIRAGYYICLTFNNNFFLGQ